MPSEERAGGIALRLSGIDMRYPGLGAPGLRIGQLGIAAGEQVAITGPSGSGKSTFVNIVTGLIRPSAGRVEWDGTDIAPLSEGRRDRWRGAHVGLVMQDFHLFAGLSALDNVLLPARLARIATPGLRDRAQDLLLQSGIQRPAQRIETMSRGEMQRVAIARALLRRPGVIVADEPTASLDPETGSAVGDLLASLARDSGATLIVVSHDVALSARMPRRIALAGGGIVQDRKAETV